MSDVNSQYITFIIADQLFGVPALQVQDVLGEQEITQVPLAPPQIAGSLNLRGRIVTAIDLRKRLDLPTRPEEFPQMSIVVEHEHELYSLIVDKVGDVLTMDAEDYERNPPTLDKRWREVSTGIFRQEKDLLVVLDIAQLLNFVETKAA
ncbi:MAG: chemotaxis protein CheW [Alphaproteobacteria bacterium]